MASDWNALYRRLENIYTLSGRDIQKAVLQNHANRKATICRRLGVVSEADIIRIANKLGLKRVL